MEKQDIFAELRDRVELSWRPRGYNNDLRSAELNQRDVEVAKELVMKAFEGKTRKASGQPYDVHLLETEALLVHSGYEDPVLRIAALLHDGPEDVPEIIPFELIEQKFSGDVARLVRGVTKPNLPGQSWRDGWSNFINQIYNAEDDRVLIVEMADRNSNLRDALRNSYAQSGGRFVGPDFWRIYSTSSPRDQLWMYNEMLKVFDKRAKGRRSPLLDDYKQNVYALRDLIEGYESAGFDSLGR